MRTALWLCICVVSTAIPLQGSDSLTISVSPAYSMAPATLAVRVRLEPSADNRAVEIIAECADFYRSSEINLEGERGPATIELHVPNVPSGDYRVVAVLKDRAGRPRAKAVRQVTVMSRGSHGVGRRHPITRPIRVVPGGSTRACAICSAAGTRPSVP